MAFNNLDSGASAKESLNLDIWYLIFDQLDSRQDLCNVCLTSRAWYTIAMPHLYKIIPLEMRFNNVFDLDWDDTKDPMLVAHSLSSRLLDDKNQQLRNVVQELDFGHFHDDEDNNDSTDMEKRLVALVNVLPNLKRVKIRGQLTQEVLQDLDGHSKRISLYLLGEDGRRQIKNDLQNVVALAAEVNPFNESEGPNRRIPGIQKLLFACPNLRSFSLETAGGYGGCVRRAPRFEMVHSFQFSGDEIFPPLEKLSLSGYRLDEAEYEHWQTKFQWSKLKSLTLGPRYTADFLKLAGGYAKSLRDLTVQVYTDADRRNCPPLRDFLRTFTSLESLTVKGYHLPAEPIRNHPDLKHLCLHSFEPTREGILKPTFSVEQLQELDRGCAHLETLELDLYRDGEWPEHVLKVLATGFRNLRRLTLHLEIGIKDAHGFPPPGVDTCIYIQPILNEDSAREVGKQFFEWRSSSNLNTLVLKTGEPLRRYPQWEPAYSVFERKNGDTIEVYKPWNAEGVPEIAVMPRSRRSYF